MALERNWCNSAWKTPSATNFFFLLIYLIWALFYDIFALSENTKQSYKRLVHFQSKQSCHKREPKSNKLTRRRSSLPMVSSMLNYINSSQEPFQPQVMLVLKSELPQSKLKSESKPQRQLKLLVLMVLKSEN